MIKKLLSTALLAACFTGCTTAQLGQASTVGSALITDVTQGTVVAEQAYAAYQAVNQNLTAANVTTGKLDPAKVLAAAQAVVPVLTGAPTQGLATAVNQFVTDVNGQIAAFKAAGVTSPAAITSAVSTSGAATVTAIAAVAPAAPVSRNDAKPATVEGWGDGKPELRVTTGLRPIYGWRDAYNVKLARD